MDKDQLDQDFVKWIENATYSQLLHRWRFGGDNDPMFQGDLGIFYRQVMTEKADQLSDEMKTKISKSVGWKK